jgi:pimeloyl-ACP methyl ester carboxylesterase
MTHRTRILLAAICILHAFFIPLQAFAQTWTGDKPYSNSRFITIDSITLHYRVWPSGLAHPRGKVVFIHGFTGSTFCFQNNYDTLVNSGYTVVALDLPAFGFSDRATWINHSQSSRAILIWKLLNMIDKGDSSGWNIIGHSMGGGTAEAVALMHLERTTSLILIDAMFFKKNSGLMSTVFSVIKIKPLNQFYFDYMENYLLTYNRMKKLLKSAYKRKPDSAEVAGYMIPLMIPGTADAIVSNFSNCREIIPLNADSLKGLNVMAVWGTRDSWIPLRMTALLKTYVPNLELHTVKGAGHMPMETHAAQFNSIMMEFLNRVNDKKASQASCIRHQ